MKKLIIIIVVLVVAVGAWYGITEWNRQRILDSGRPVLLVNRSEGSYTWSDLFLREDITRKYKIKGYLDELSEEEIQEAISGYGLVVGPNADPNDPRTQTPPPVEVPSPDEDQLVAWQEALETLSNEQQQFCAAIDLADESQYCFFRHIVRAIMLGNGPAQGCQTIFVETFRNQCQRDVERNNLVSVEDSNNNNIIDEFELHSEAPAS